MERTSIAQQVADEIGDRIRKGIWVGRLPGIRPLASELEVSPLTVRAALEILERAAVIAPAVAGKQRQIFNAIPARSRRQSGLSGCRIAYLSSRPSLQDCEAIDREALEILRREFEARGATVSVVVDPRAFTIGQPGHHLQKLVAERPMDFWIIIAPSAQLARWFAEENIPQLIVGGGHSEFGTTATFTLPGKTVPILEALVKFGHQRIVLPIPEIWHRNAERPISFEREFLRLLKGAGLPASAFNTPRFGGTPESFSKCLESTFAHTPPTAVITTCLREHLSAVGFLRRKSLQMPEDVSLATLAWQPEADWISPNPTCFKHSTKSLVKAVASYVDRAVRRGPPENPLLIEGDGEFLRGESLAPAPTRQKLNNP